MRVAACGLAMALALALSVSAHARVRGYSIYDGDTFRATFRIANIDTPELKGKCAHEIELAERAKLFTQQFLAQGDVVITQTGVDRYGRVLATVRRGDEDLGAALIAAGLARAWRGRRESWCD